MISYWNYNKIHLIFLSWPGFRFHTVPGLLRSYRVNACRPRQNGCHFADDNFKLTIEKEIVRISIESWLKFLPKGSIDNEASLVPVMAWCRPDANVCRWYPVQWRVYAYPGLSELMSWRCVLDALFAFVEIKATGMKWCHKKICIPNKFQYGG